MIIPIRTDYRMTRTPWVNYGLIAINVILFLLNYNGGYRARIEDLMLHPDNPELHQFFTSVFLHAGWTHIIGNMLFLWVFGNAVNDRFGNVGYLAFYLAGGILAGVGYLLLSANAPVLGASGAISAVTGAYLVLLPRVRVTLLALLFYIFMPFEVSSLYFLLFQLVFNLWMSLSPSVTGQASGGVAYVAHSSGYVFGIAVAGVFLALRIIPRDPYDLLSLIGASHRRRRYRRAVAGGYDPFSPVGSKLRRGGGRWVETRLVDDAAADGEATRQIQLRRRISESASANDLPGAARTYLELLEIDPQAVLGRRQQLDVANQFMASEQYPAAANAYERFGEHYGDYEHLADIYLMLGLIYGRYIRQYDRAERYLQQAMEKLGDPRKIDMARADLEIVRRRLGR